MNKLLIVVLFFVSLAQAQRFSYPGKTPARTPIVTNAFDSTGNVNAFIFLIRGDTTQAVLGRNFWASTGNPSLVLDVRDNGRFPVVGPSQFGIRLLNRGADTVIAQIGVQNPAEAFAWGSRVNLTTNGAVGPVNKWFSMMNDTLRMYINGVLRQAIFTDSTVTNNNLWIERTDSSYGINLMNNTDVPVDGNVQSSPFLRFTARSNYGGTRYLTWWRLQAQAFSSPGAGGAVLVASFWRANGWGYPFAIDEQGRVELGGNFHGEDFSSYKVLLKGNVTVGHAEDSGDTTRQINSLRVNGKLTVYGALDDNYPLSRSLGGAYTITPALLIDRMFENHAAAKIGNPRVTVGAVAGTPSGRFYADSVYIGSTPLLVFDDSRNLTNVNNATIGGTLGVTGTSTLAAVNASGDIGANSGTITTSSATFNLATATTGNFTLGGTGTLVVNGPIGLGTTGSAAALIIKPYFLGVGRLNVIDARKFNGGQIWGLDSSGTVWFGPTGGTGTSNISSASGGLKLIGKTGGTTLLDVQSSNLTSRFSIDTVGTAKGTTYFADTSSFDAATTRKAIYISGATANDIYIVAAKYTTDAALPPVGDECIAYAKTDSLVVKRDAGTTANLKFSYVRVSH